MKIKVENLGVLKQAEFELGDLTIICGDNNSGKTYATYALFGFLHFWERILKIEVTNQQINDLLRNGILRIDLTDYAKQANRILERDCKEYSEKLDTIFASKSAYFKDSRFQIELAMTEKTVIDQTFENKIRSGKAEFLSLTKSEGEKELVVSLLAEREIDDLPYQIIKEMISTVVTEVIFDRFFPKPFIASAERTGAAIFRKELNFARNRLLEEMSQSSRDIDPLDLLLKSSKDYALPVKFNVDFIRKLEDIAKEDSFLRKEHPEILNQFTFIIGGEYIAGSNDTIYFKPSKQQVKLTMDESSSAVRSLLDIGFYLRHTAERGDLLMVDEPELNLHPKNQRLIARLFARLVNLGIKVFITTHSDYIIKELNTLIMLNQDRPYLKKIAEKEGYKPEELISPEQARVYIAEKALIQLEGKQRRSQCQTLVPAKIDPEFGIEARSFDETIDKMNEIQDAIVWGDDE